jgi:phospho-acceptor domain-containing protein
VRLKDLAEVRFDDRLLTVLNQPAGDRHDAAVRWRQLVDLVARAGPGASSPAIAQALESIRSQAPEVEKTLRSAAARAVAGRPLPLGLLEYFASDQLSVSAPVLAAATLDGAQWRGLLAAANEETRRFVETLHPEAASAPPAATEKAIEPTVTPDVEPGAAPSLHDVVARIERRRRSREVQRVGVMGTDVAMPVGSPSLFRWECGPSGEIAWVDGAPRGALIGRTIARVQEDDDDRVDAEVVRAFGMRAPFRDRELTVAGGGALAGQWKISGIPAFEPTDGRFAGYRGVALRETPPETAGEAPSDIFADPDSLRELVHEIKTPLTAIIGFAEIIEGQYLGPADHRYRLRAGEIVAQARLLLMGIDDLDFAAKIHSSADAADRRADLAPLLAQAAASLRERTAEKDVQIALATPAGNVIAAIEPELAERLLVRLVGAVVERAERGERLRFAVEQTAAHWRVSIARPAGLRNIPEAELLESGTSFSDEREAQALSIGFALRLVRGLARIAGADLALPAAEFVLLFPRA